MPCDAYEIPTEEGNKPNYTRKGCHLHILGEQMMYALPQVRLSTSRTVFVTAYQPTHSGDTGGILRLDGACTGATEWPVNLLHMIPENKPASHHLPVSPAATGTSNTSARNLGNFLNVLCHQNTSNNPYATFDFTKAMRTVANRISSSLLLVPPSSHSPHPSRTTEI